MTSKQCTNETTGDARHAAYRDNFEHLNDELKKLDMLIRLRIMKLKQQEERTRRITIDPKLYVSYDEVEDLLKTAGNSQTGSMEPHAAAIYSEIETLRNRIDARISASIDAGIFLALPRLAQIFDLSPFELQVVVICMAPELRQKYDKIFVYLQNDIGSKKPSIHMVLDMLCEKEDESWYARAVFSHHAPLIRPGILQVADDPRSPSASGILTRFLTLDPRILDFLLGAGGIDKRLMDTVKLYEPPVALEPGNIHVHPDIMDRIIRFTTYHTEQSQLGLKKIVLHFQGPYGVGKRDMAAAICRRMGCLLLYLDLEPLVAKQGEIETLLRLAFREGLLMQALLYIDNADLLLAPDVRGKTLLKSLARITEEFGWLTILAGQESWTVPGLFENTVFYTARFPVPPVEIRQKTWAAVMENEDIIADRDKRQWGAELARRFRLTPGQIRDAAEYERCRRIAEENGSSGNGKKVTIRHFYTACRNQSNRKLGQLAIKIEPNYQWRDIVLPHEKILKLKEICSQVTHRHRVFSQWGFREKLSYGVGLSVLFAGVSGTGKTMAAEVMAKELGLDLYKVDLSGVVSKYIGETEKNLDRIFHEAETANAILFFDEADALFGKRTQVKDAHDRYANIETAYLLQKMEAHEGIVILASNLRKNMDDAFVRRIRFIVEFPFPDEKSRLTIWKNHFPKKAPKSETIDYELLAKQFPVTGGSIRNIVLNAAFCAAQNGGTIEMEHIISVARSEYEKIGKLWPRGVATGTGQITAPAKGE